MEWCDFVVFAEEDTLIQRIYWDSGVMQDIRERADFFLSFFFSTLPFINICSIKHRFVQMLEIFKKTQMLKWAEFILFSASACFCLDFMSTLMSSNHAERGIPEGSPPAGPVNTDLHIEMMAWGGRSLVLQHMRSIPC